ncbi:MAG TPA: GlxA family transcriptional regulator [Hyphomonadaceae bacterium]|nr:GlxA family transcriptional regulator [Hyphomonadaceae bacterium]
MPGKPRSVRTPTLRNGVARKIGVMIFDDFQLLDAAGPISTFEMPSRLKPAPYEIQIIAPEPGQVRSSSGASMYADPLPRDPKYDTLIVSGGWGTRKAMLDPKVQQFILKAAKSARRVCSVCSGAYILAAAGLLDGKRATTHWRRTPDFQQRFPKVKLEPNCIYTRDGKVWTSAGITAGIDLSLALIADDLGEDISRSAAQELVVYHRRPGGQSQFSAMLEIERTQGRFTPLLAWMRERLDEPLSVEDLAHQSNMSPRNFARAFAAETGVTPAKAVERLRLETAREQVENSHDPLDQIALHSGFRDPERMRRAFLRSFGQPPQALRRLARGQPAA